MSMLAIAVARSDHPTMMRVLVTGGAGFIGSHIAEAYVGRGSRVVVLDNFSTGKRENLAGFAGDIELIEGDVRDATLLARAAQGCDVVFHQAAIVSVPYSVSHPEESNSVNIQGTLNVLQAARSAGVRRVVFASSAAVYGDEPTLPKHEAMLPSPISPYGVEKLTGEHYLAVWSRVFGVETVALRYFNVFGPRQDPSSPYSGVISIFVDRILGGKPITFLGDGSQSRDFVSISNVVEANVLAAAAPGASGRVFNVACGARTTLVELAAVLESAVGRTVPREFALARPGDIKDSVADITRARTELGYAPSVGLSQGLVALVAYAQAAGTTTPA
jgi:UDP-glucose 4-epimerase